MHSGRKYWCSSWDPKDWHNSPQTINHRATIDLQFHTINLTPNWALRIKSMASIRRKLLFRKAFLLSKETFNYNPREGRYKIHSNTLFSNLLKVVMPTKVHWRSQNSPILIIKMSLPLRDDATLWGVWYTPRPEGSNIVAFKRKGNVRPHGNKMEGNGERQK